MKFMRILLVSSLAFLCSGCWQVVVVRIASDLFFSDHVQREYSEDGQVLRAEIACKPLEEYCYRQVYHDNGNVHKQGPWSEYGWEGRVQEYDEDEFLVKSLSYYKSKLNGTCMYFHPNGRVECEFNCEDDLLHGSYYCMDEEGNVLWRANYHRGALHGPYFELDYMRVMHEAWYQYDSLLYFVEYNKDGEVVDWQGPDDWRTLLEEF